MTATLLLLLKAAVGLIVFAIGMDSTVKAATHLLHRPGLLLRSVLAMYVLVPLAALALVKVLTLAPGVEIGLLVLAAPAAVLASLAAPADAQRAVQGPFDSVRGVDLSYDTQGFLNGKADVTFLGMK